MFAVVVLHGELAVPYTRNPPQRGGIPPLGKAQGPISQGVASTAGSHAAQARELRQGLTAATVSDVPRAPWERLARASPDDMPPSRSQREVLDHFFVICRNRDSPDFRISKIGCNPANPIILKS